MARRLREIERRTRIVATLGPASRDESVIEGLLKAGLDVARINFSHGDPADRQLMVRRLRGAAKRLGVEVAVLADLSGPKIRLRDLAEEPIQLRRGAQVVLTPASGRGTPERLTVAHAALCSDVSAGDKILLSDGRVSLEALAVGKTEIRCRVTGGGPLRSRAGVNLPDSRVTSRNPTALDLRHAEEALTLGADWFALSFVQSGAEVERLRKWLVRRNALRPIMAKVEKPQAMERLEEVLDASDGVIVARGDLGVECPPEDVPLYQKRIIREANLRAKPVVTATQMLESMVEATRPTRAEASDVANAILDGTDAVMLSAETTLGRHPVRTVRMMASIARRTESSEAYRLRFARIRDADIAPGDVTEAVAQAARRAAEHSQAAAIIVFSYTGESARRVARQRPGLPIFVLTPELSTLRQLKLVQGLLPLLLPRARTTDALVSAGLRLVRDRGLLAAGTLVTIVAGSNPLVAASNMMKLSRIPSASD